jgi:hypothetical protein
MKALTTALKALTTALKALTTALKALGWLVAGISTIFALMSAGRILSLESPNVLIHLFMLIFFGSLAFVLAFLLVRRG